MYILETACGRIYIQWKPITCSFSFRRAQLRWFLQMLSIQHTQSLAGYSRNMNGLLAALLSLRRVYSLFSFLKSFLFLAGVSRCLLCLWSTIPASSVFSFFDRFFGFEGAGPNLAAMFFDRSFSGIKSWSSRRNIFLAHLWPERGAILFSFWIYEAGRVVAFRWATWTVGFNGCHFLTSPSEAENE